MTERDDLMDRLQLLSEQEATQTALFQQLAAAGMSWVTDMKALSILLREGPQTAGALVARLHITSGAVTGVADRLSAAGLARREHDSSDRRRVVVSAVPEGFADRVDVYAGIGQAFQHLYERLHHRRTAIPRPPPGAAVEITTQQAAMIAERQ